jgi:hypothetical protein
MQAGLPHGLGQAGLCLDLNKEENLMSASKDPQMYVEVSLQKTVPNQLCIGDFRVMPGQNKKRKGYLPSAKWTYDF